MMKRIIALLLALILTVGLLPTVALAAEETANTNVVPGSIGTDGKWSQTPPTQPKVDGVKTVDKTAEKVAGTDNQYKVTLTVVLEQTEEEQKPGAAATVLVLDTSGSMAYCAECGAKDDCVHNYVSVPGKPSKKETYYYKYTNENGQVRFGEAYYCDGKHTARFWLKHPAGWFTTSSDSLDHKPTRDSLAGQTMYVKSTTPRASRLDAAKVAAENFLKTYSGLTFNTDGTVAANQNSRNLGRYVSVVSFATGAALKQEWVDVSNANNYQTVLNKIKALKADGGTNLDAGLTYAEYLLKQTAVNDAVKNVIALTDGQPTFFIDTNEDAYDDDGLTYSNKEFLTIDRTKYRVHGTGDSCNAKTFTETVASAVAVKNHAKLYTVCFDADEKIGVPDSENQISVSEYLSTKIATQPTKTGEQFAYDASNAEQLYAEFAKITQSIVSGLSTGTVKDTLPTGITSAAFDEGNVKEWKLNEAPFTKNETPNTVGGKQVTTYTYTYTYTVTIDPEKASLVEVGGEKYAPLNGETTLTVGSGADAKEIPFPIPAGKVTMPSHTVTWKSQDGNTTLETDNNVEYNTQPSFDRADPTKADDAQYTYTFVGWATEANKETGTLEEDLPPVTDDVTYYAAFSKTARTYTVTWMPQDGQGNAYETDTGVAYNARPSYDSEVPTKAADAEHTYTFVGWATSANQETGTLEANLPAVTADVTYYAAFSKTPRTYTVTWMPQDGQGNAYETDTSVAYNARPSYDGAEPTKAADAEHTYTFVGWATTPNQTSGSAVVDLPNVTADVTYYAAFSATKQTYTIRFETEAGGTLTGTTECTGLSHGADFPAAPTTTSNVGYYFDGWYKDNTKVTSFPTTVTENATYTAKWLSYKSINLDLTRKIQKTLNSDVALTNEIFTINLTLNGAEVPSATATATVSPALDNGSYTDTKPFVVASGDFKLTFTAPGIYNYSIVEAEDGQLAGMTYDVGFANGHTMIVNVDENTTTNELYVKSVTIDGKTVYTHGETEATPTWLTITNNYVEPKKTFDLNNTIFKTFTPVAGGLPIPTGEGISYTFTARMTEQTKEGFAVGNTGRNYTLKATLTGEVTEANKVPFVVDSTTSSEVEFAPGTYYFLVQEDSTAAVTGTVNGTIHNDSQAYLLILTVKEDLTFETDVKTAVVVTSLEEPTPGLGTITFNNTYEEKEPGKYTIDFSDLIVKCLTKEGSKAFTGAEFTANVSGWKYMKEEAKPWAMLANATSFAFTDLPSRTLTATFLADAVFNPDNEAYRPFTGDTLTVEEGDYLFLIEENNGGQSNITYDEAKYWLAVRVRFEDDEPIVAVYRRTYTAGDSYNTVLENETEWSNPIPANITPVTFHNTIDTGKDDYYPIIIPTIIGKDTGMLNKTDHFAYVIGYPDGTVHPNGQITRAEVATIFFRLLRDEVRDGAFTTSNTYSDVAYGKWYNNPISTMSALGIITGYPDGTFKPNKPITRAEFAAIAARFDETQSGKSATFSDVIGHWAAKEIGIAYYNDWIKGYPDGTFKPDQNITRAEAMTLINRVLERKPESPADLLTDMNKWTDNMDTSKWYYLDVQEATNSHGYTRKTFNYELWRQMLPDPDWSRYER